MVFVNTVDKLYIYSMKPNITLNFVTSVNLEELEDATEFVYLYYNEIQRKVLMATESKSKAILKFKLDEHKKLASNPKVEEIGFDSRCIGYSS